jgi:hypothetical protein
LATDRRAEAQRLEAQAANYERGSAGERVVGAAIDAMSSRGWVALHDVRWPGRPKANIDHVVIGPGGIVVVDAKNWSGAVTVRDGVLRQAGHRRTRELEAVGDAAEAVGGLMALPWSLHVIPVLCTVGHPEISPTRLGRVTLLDATQLGDWLVLLPAQLEADAVAGLTSFLRTALSRDGALGPSRAVVGPSPYGSHPLAEHRVQRRRTWGAARPSRRAPRRRPSRSGRARARRTGPELRKLGLVLALLVFLALGGAPVLTGLADSFGSAAAKQYQNQVPSAAPAVPSPAPTYATCALLDARFPHGIARPGAVNRGARPTGLPHVDSVGYARNARLDTDHDGLACER